MSRFDVLSRETKVDSNLVLEASAGTGKTFSIENLVVRLLVEGECPLKIDQILLVTFTKMATSDLRTRVRDNIEKAMNALEDGNAGKFDYLTPILANEERRMDSRRRLERALIGFDEAQIFTIHSFCYRMISEYGMDGSMAPDPQEQGRGVGEERYKQCVLDYFRTALDNDSVGGQHRKLALSSQRGSVDQLQRELARIIAKGIAIETVPDHQTLIADFQQTVKQFKDELKIEPEKLSQDLEKLIASMLKVQGYDQNDILKLVALFSKDVWGEEDFELLVENGSCLMEFLHPDNKKKKFPEQNSFNYPDFLEKFQESFKVLKYKNLGFARMAYDCQKLMRHQFDEEELKSFDDLLDVMSEKICNPEFLHAVRNRYRAVIVDEFQDTDPRQWGIFKALFSPEKSDWGNLYLVGDPKQSIYAFRQADIYTYLDAADAIGREHVYSLDTNYRSQPSLVEGLNELFNDPFDQGWIPLPKLQKFLDVPAVEWDKEKQNRSFSDNRSAIHFCIHQSDRYQETKSEDEAFFPFFVQEIQRLHKKDGLSLRSFAILVSDRHQANRVSAYLKKWNIPSQRQRVEPISESPVIASLKELLFGIFHYREESALKTALGGHFIRWNHKKIETLDDDQEYAKVLAVFRELEECWRTEGLSVCMEKLLYSSWIHHPETVLENILRQEHGEQFYADFQHIMELILEEPRTQSEVLMFLEKFKFDTTRNEEDLKRRFDIGQDAVQIVTIHSSKGLEYDVVFTPGLIKRATKMDPYYAYEGKLHFVFEKDDERFGAYLEELDAEKMRQLYVACTRAKYRLYLPLIESKKIDKQGYSSPMELFVQGFKKPLEQFLAGSSISYTILNDVPSVLSVSEDEKSPEICAPIKVELSYRSISMHSFSSLAQTHASELIDVPHSFEAEEKSLHTLPSGSETGTLLHRLLEEIPFSLGLQWESIQDVIPLVEPYVKDTKYEEWINVLAEIVFQAVTVPFINGAALRDIDPDKCKFESEFLFPYDSESYMKGFIDLMFFHGGKYYLLDWKSNWLGKQSEDYSEQNLNQAMDQHQYFLQAEIYTHSLEKYLKLIHAEPFKDLFGGVYYVFLRGLPNHGIKFIDPTLSAS